MKCPACQHTCSEDHDLCPECLADLREHKTLLGYPVHDASSSYNQLLTHSCSTEVSPSNYSPGSTWKALAGIFKREAPISRPTDTLATVEVASSIVPEQEQSYDEIQEFSEVHLALENITEVLEDQQKTIEQVSLEIGAGTNGTGTNCYSDISNHQTTADIQEPLPTLAYSATHEINYDSSEIRTLLNVADQELRTIAVCEVDMSVETFYDSDTVNMLFDIADDYLIDPAMEHQYVELQKAADTKQLESASLMQQLKVTQAAIGSNFINLKGSLASISPFKASAEKNESHYKTLANITLSSPAQVKRANFIDIAAIVIIASLATLGFIIVKETYFWQALCGRHPLLPANLITMLGWYGVTLIITATLYFLLTLGISASTFGMDLVGVRTIHRDQREHTSQELLARSFVIVANYFLLVWIYAWICGRSYCDWLTQSMYIDPSD